MKYRIGEVAEFFDMTKEGIRYLERQGIICSERDEQNGYRYFSRDAITRLKQIKRYQSLGFSLEEAQEMICETAREEIDERLKKKMQELEVKEQQIAHMKSMVLSQQEVVRRLVHGEERFRIGMRPEMLFLPRVSAEASVEKPGAKKRIAQARNVEKTWILAAPPCVLGGMHFSKNGESERVLGTMVRAESARAVGLPVPSEAIRLPSCLCVCGTIEAPLGEKPDIAPMLAFAQERNCEMCDDVYGVLWLNYRTADGRRWGIHELFMPIRQNNIKMA